MKQALENKPVSRSRAIAAALVALALVVILVLTLDSPWRSQAALTPAASESGAQENREDELLNVATQASRSEEKSDPAVEVSAEQAVQVSSPAPTFGRVHGSVFDDAGVAIKGAWVWTLLDNGDRKNAKSNADGHYELDGVSLGSRRITVWAENHHEEAQTLVFTEEAPSHEHDFYLRKQQRIRVRMTSSTGEPAFEALAKSGISSFQWKMVPVATSEDPGETFDGVTGSLNNRFGIGTFWESGYQGLPPLTPDEYGTITLLEDGPAWLSLVVAHQVIRKQRVDPATEVVTFVLDPSDVLALRAGVRGRVVDEAGVPIASTCSVGEEEYRRSHNPLTNAEGDFLIEDLLPGNRYLVVESSERAALMLPVRLKPGQVLDVGVLTMRRPVELSGRVVDASGKSVGAFIDWGPLDSESGAVAWVRRGSTTSDAEGRFTISGLAPDVWLVTVAGLPLKGVKPYDPVIASLPSRIDARNGSVADIELVVHETGTLVLVTEITEEPWPHIQAIDKFGLPAGGTWVGRWTVETPLRLPPGVYELVATRAEKVLERRIVEVDANPKRLEFTFAPVPK